MTDPRAGKVRRARDIRPGDVVADCGGETHEVIAVETAGKEVILHAADDLAIITGPNHQLVLPGVEVPAAPPAPKVRRTRKVRPVDSGSEFQRLAGVQGRHFDEQCRITLRHAGYDVSDRPFAVPELGIEVDAEAKATNGFRLWCEFKGSWLGTRPGTRRTDTAKKAICNAMLAWGEGEWPPMILLTSHLPEPGSRGATMMDVALRLGALLAVVDVYAGGADAQLRSLAYGEAS